MSGDYKPKGKIRSGHAYWPRGQKHGGTVALGSAGAPSSGITQSPGPHAESARPTKPHAGPHTEPREFTTRANDEAKPATGGANKSLEQLCVQKLPNPSKQAASTHRRKPAIDPRPLRTARQEKTYCDRHIPGTALRDNTANECCLAHTHGDLSPLRPSRRRRCRSSAGKTVSP